MDTDFETIILLGFKSSNSISYQQEIKKAGLLVFRYGHANLNIIVFKAKNKSPNILFI